MNRDIYAVKLTGLLSLLLGIITTLTGLVAVVLTILAFSFGQLTEYSARAAGQLALIVITGLALTALGAELQAVTAPVVHDPEHLRLSWTALVIANVFSSGVSFWLLPVFANLTLLVLLALLFCRQSVIRLTS